MAKKSDLWNIKLDFDIAPEITSVMGGDRKKPVKKTLDQDILEVYDSLDTRRRNARNKMKKEVDEITNVDKIAKLLDVEFNKLGNKVATASSNEKTSAATVRLLEQINKSTGYVKTFHENITNNYYRKSLEIQYRQLFALQEQVALNRIAFSTMTQQLESLVLNTALPDILKFGGNVSFFGQIEAKQKQMMIEQFAKGLDDFQNKIFQKGFDWVGKNMGKMKGKMADFATKRIHNSKILDKLGVDKTKLLERIHGKLATKVKTGSFSKQDLDKKAEFDGRVHQAIVKVIPGLLSKIHAEVKAFRTKTEPADNELMYDDKTNDFITTKSFVKNMQKKIGQEAKKVVNTKTKKTIAILEKMGKIKLSPNEQEDLSNALLNFALEGMAPLTPSLFTNSAFLKFIGLPSLKEKVQYAGIKILEAGKNNLNAYRAVQKALYDIKGGIEATYNKNLGEYDKLFKAGHTSALKKLGVTQTNKDGEIEFSDFGSKNMFRKNAGFSTMSKAKLKEINDVDNGLASSVKLDKKAEADLKLLAKGGDVSGKVSKTMTNGQVDVDQLSDGELGMYVLSPKSKVQDFFGKAWETLSTESQRLYEKCYKFMQDLLGQIMTMGKSLMDKVQKKEKEDSKSGNTEEAQIVEEIQEAISNQPDPKKAKARNFIGSTVMRFAGTIGSAAMSTYKNLNTEKNRQAMKDIGSGIGGAFKSGWELINKIKKLLILAFRLVKIQLRKWKVKQKIYDFVTFKSEINPLTIIQSTLAAIAKGYKATKSGLKAFKADPMGTIKKGMQSTLKTTREWDKKIAKTILKIPFTGPLKAFRLGRKIAKPLAKAQGKATELAIDALPFGLGKIIKPFAMVATKTLEVVAGKDKDEADEKKKSEKEKAKEEKVAKKKEAESKKAAIKEEKRKEAETEKKEAKKKLAESRDDKNRKGSFFERINIFKRKKTDDGNSKGFVQKAKEVRDSKGMAITMGIMAVTGILKALNLSVEDVKEFAGKTWDVLKSIGGTIKDVYTWVSEHFGSTFAAILATVLAGAGIYGLRHPLKLGKALFKGAGKIIGMVGGVFTAQTVMDAADGKKPGTPDGPDKNKTPDGPDKAKTPGPTPDAPKKSPSFFSIEGIKHYGGKAVDGLKSGVEYVGGKIADGAKWVWGAIKTSWSWCTKTIANAATSAWEAAKRAGTWVADFSKKAMQAAISTVKNLAGKAKEMLCNLWTYMKDKFGSPDKAKNTLESTVDNIGKQMEKHKRSLIKRGLDVPKVMAKVFLKLMAKLLPALTGIGAFLSLALIAWDIITFLKAWLMDGYCLWKAALYAFIGIDLGPEDKPEPEQKLDALTGADQVAPSVVDETQDNKVAAPATDVEMPASKPANTSSPTPPVTSPPGPGGGNQSLDTIGSNSAFNGNNSAAGAAAGGAAGAAAATTITPPPRTSDSQAIQANASGGGASGAGLTKEKFDRITNGALEYNQAMALFNKYGLNTPLQQASFLAVTGAESNFQPVAERTGYSLKGAEGTWGYFKKPGPRRDKLLELTNQGKKTADPTKFAELVYGPGSTKEKELGNTRPGDGYLFRGRGWVQLTGRSNYAKTGQSLGMSAEQVANYVMSPPGALESSLIWWKNNNANRYISDSDPGGSVMRVAALANYGSAVGKDGKTKVPHRWGQRKVRFDAYYPSLVKGEGLPPTQKELASKLAREAGPLDSQYGSRVVAGSYKPPPPSASSGGGSAAGAVAGGATGAAAGAAAGLAGGGGDTSTGAPAGSVAGMPKMPTASPDSAARLAAIEAREAKEKEENDKQFAAAQAAYNAKTTGSGPASLGTSETSTKDTGDSSSRSSTIPMSTQDIKDDTVSREITWGGDTTSKLQEQATNALGSATSAANNAVSTVTSTANNLAGQATGAVSSVTSGLGGMASGLTTGFGNISSGLSATGSNAKSMFTGFPKIEAGQFASAGATPGGYGLTSQGSTPTNLKTATKAPNSIESGMLKLVDIESSASSTLVDIKTILMYMAKKENERSALAAKEKEEQAKLSKQTKEEVQDIMGPIINLSRKEVFDIT